MRIIAAAGALALAALYWSINSAEATTWVPIKVKCPVGGKAFQTRVMASNTIFGQRPDGRSFSPSPIPWIDECPDNGFVIFEEKFTKEEIKNLTALVMSSEYQALRQNETRHYRAWWLMERLGRDAYSTAIAALIATWGTDEDAVRKARYQDQFVAVVVKLNFSEEKRDSWFWLRMRAANALRERGRFPESDALIQETMLPARMPAEADQLAGATRLAEGLRALNKDRNPNPHPANLLPPRVAIDRCAEQGLSKAELDACGGPEVKAEQDELSKWREEQRTASQSEGDAASAAGAASQAASDAAAAASDAVRDAEVTPGRKRQRSN